MYIFGQAQIGRSRCAQMIIIRSRDCALRLFLRLSRQNNLLSNFSLLRSRRAAERVGKPKRARARDARGRLFSPSPSLIYIYHCTRFFAAYCHYYPITRLCAASRRLPLHVVGRLFAFDAFFGEFRLSNEILAVKY